MVYYVILGLIWVGVIEYLLTQRIEGESPFNNITRAINLVIWPIGFTIMVVSWIKNKLS